MHAVGEGYGVVCGVWCVVWCGVWCVVVWWCVVVYGVWCVRPDAGFSLEVWWALGQSDLVLEF